MLTTLPSKSTAHVRRTACAADARDAQLPKQRRSISDRVTHARPRVQRAQRRSCKARTVTGRAQHSMLRAPASAHPLGFFRRGWRARSCGTPGHSKRRGSDSLRSAQPCDASTAELQNWGRTGRRGSFVPYVCVMRLLYLGTSGYRPLTTHIERLTRKGSRMPASLDRRSFRWLVSVSVRQRTRLPQDTWQGQRPQTNEQRGEQ